MKRPVQWSRDALDDIKDQVTYVARDNPAAARRIASSIRSTGVRLGEMATGRPGRVAGTYEKLVPRLPYILAYAIVDRPDASIIVILRVTHAARDWTPEDWPD